MVVVNEDMIITLVNPAFCAMFKTTKDQLLYKHARDLLGNVKNFQMAWEQNRVFKSREKQYPKYDLYVRKVIFPIKDEGLLVACIMVDLSHEWHQRNEMPRIKREIIEQVNEVVNKKMHVAQQIAGLLGETTAETKVSLLKLREMLEQETM
ncbi:PAS domain protein [Candidatus Vecturithrix granuli]|uniref:PAS domain protein n=1 Tax=Vecturithrix granuli TaxID=1499967 RepID=A0A081BWN5_VECG1|nr:PAS domain protein [Candidatus Vecturithrix granuli]